MERFNLWITLGNHSKIVCYGSQSDMNKIALSANLAGDVHVLPDGDEPNSPTTIHATASHHCVCPGNVHAEPASFGFLSHYRHSGANPMEKKLVFTRLPGLCKLRQALAPLEPPFAVEVRQGVGPGLPGTALRPYHEFWDCPSVETIHEFLSCPENGVLPDSPFELIVEQIADPIAAPAVQALSAEERNPLLSQLGRP